MKKTFRFIDSSSNILNFEAYFCYDYKDFLNKNYTEKTDYESQNIFEKVFSNKETFIGVFSENPLGFRTFIKTNDIVLMQYIRSLKFIFYNPNDNFYELHFFEILTKEDINRLKILKKENFINNNIISVPSSSLYKLEDGRIYIKFSDDTGQLFSSENEFTLYEKMINNF